MIFSIDKYYIIKYNTVTSCQLFLYLHIQQCSVVGFNNMRYEIFGVERFSLMAIN